MEKYCHSRNFTVNFPDVDAYDRLKPTGYLNFAQEVACSSADELGFGYQDLKPVHQGFLVVNTVVECVRPLFWGETFTLQTWPLPPRHSFFERHYRFLKGEEELAKVASRWCLVDLNDFSLLSADKLAAHANCPYRDEKVIPVPAYRIPKLDESAEEAYRTTARYSLCDHYRHVNNARYADLFCDCFTMEEFASRQIRRFRITYGKQIREGEEIVFYKKEIDGEYVLEARVGGEVRAQFAIIFQGE